MQLRLRLEARRHVLLIVWLAATINFFLPRLGGQDPIRQMLVQQAAMGGSIQTGLEEMIEIYNEKFGLNTPLWQQYLTYLGDMSRLDFNYSITSYPQRVSDIIGRAMPWTLVLLTTTTLFSWVLGTLLGAFMGWPRAPKFLSFLMPPLLSLNAIPFFLLGLVLIYLFAFHWRIFPLFGGYTAGHVSRHDPGLSQRRVLPFDPAGALDHPRLSRRLGTRDARHDGHHPGRGLRHLCRRQRAQGPHHLPPLRDPQRALAAGDGAGARARQLVSGAVLVEVVFSYPGIGSVLYEGIRSGDFFVVQGIIFILILSIGLATLILDLIYPLLDPRITYQRA